MKVFLTGASGYIGLHILKDLVAHGHTVAGLTRSDAGVEIVKAAGGTPVRGDIKNLALIREQAVAADATIHTAFDHTWVDFAGACADELRLLKTVGEAYEGTGKALVMSSGTLMCSGMPGFDEDTVPAPNEHIPRVANERYMHALGDKGVRAICIRIAPMVHSEDMNTHIAFIAVQVRAHLKAGFVAKVKDDVNWGAANVTDVATLFRLALEKSPVGWSAYHAVGALTPISDIVRLTAAKYDLPIKQISPEEAPAHFGFLGAFIGTDNPAPTALTQQRLDWKPTKPSLVQELEAGKYWHLIEE